MDRESCPRVSSGTTGRGSDMAGVDTSVSVGSCLGTPLRGSRTGKWVCLAWESPVAGGYFLGRIYSNVDSGVPVEEPSAVEVSFPRRVGLGDPGDGSPPVSEPVAPPTSPWSWVLRLSEVPEVPRTSLQPSHEQRSYYGWTAIQSRLGGRLTGTPTQAGVCWTPSTVHCFDSRRGLGSPVSIGS